MTLLELVVGLTISGVVAVAGYGTFASMVDHRVRARTQADAITRAAAARRTLVGWLTGTRLLADEAGPSFRGLDGIYEDAPDDELTFLTTVTGRAGPSETVVRLFIDRDTVTPERGLTAELSVWRGTEVERVEIEPRAVGLDARYMTRLLGESEWLPSWISSTVLPVGVELSILASSPDSLPPLLRLPMVVPVGAGR